MKPMKRGRWIALALFAAILLVAAVAWHRLSTGHLEPWGFLAHVVQLERAAADPNSLQSLGWSLAILGRDDEVRTLNLFPGFEPPARAVEVGRLDLHTVPWREGIEKIAAEHRLVMIMEDHFVSKHREFIGATLPLFRDTGFTHYAAEAIGPLDTSLAQRGYPTSRTGFTRPTRSSATHFAARSSWISPSSATTSVPSRMAAGTSSPRPSWRRTSGKMLKPGCSCMPGTRTF